VNEIWNKVYASNASFFGDDPSNFGLNCHKEFQKHGVKKLLELGCGQGRDTTFFASNGIETKPKRIYQRLPIYIPCRRFYSVHFYKIHLRPSCSFVP
jgi:hypothetical protein